MSTSPILHLHAPGLNLRTRISHEAIPDLLVLVQRYRTDEPLPDPADGSGSAGRQGSAGPGKAGPSFSRSPAEGGEAVDPGHRETLPAEAHAIKESLKTRALQELSPLLRGARFPDKILVLLGWLEGQTPHPINKRDLRGAFVGLGELPPANPGRDLRSLTKAGLVAGGRHDLSVTEAGWSQIRGLLDPSAQDSPN